MADRENEPSLLGKMLLDMGVINQTQLSEALNLMEMSGARSLGDILLKMGMVREEVMAYALGQKLNLPVFSLKSCEIPRKVLELVPEKLIRKHLVLPYSLEDGVLTVIMADPLDLMVIDDIQYQTGFQVREGIGLKSEILENITRFFQTSNSEIKDAVNTLSAASDGLEMEDEAGKKTVNLEEKDNPTVAIVNNLIADAIKMHASDIHIEPHEANMGIRYRMDGVLQERNLNVPIRTQHELISRIKLLSGMDISEHRLPQDGRIKVKTPVQDKVIQADLRVSALPVYRGEKICIRILDKTSLKLTLEDVGFSELNLKIFKQVVDKPSGIILMTGPTGSGKTSTLYAALNFINSPEINISTVEDPVEYEISAFNQVQIQAKIGLNFARVLRALLRQDPDVILIGEIRDEETAKIAVEAALTGHLVFSTLHTNDAPSSVSRLEEMHIEPYLLASTVRGIVAQRLVRRLCPKCKTKVAVDPAKAEQLAKTYGVENPTIFKPRGCPSCNNAGFRGRTAIHEIMTINDELAQAICKRVSTTDLAIHAKRLGFKTLAFDGYTKVLKGVTTFREVEKVAMA